MLPLRAVDCMSCDYLVAINIYEETNNQKVGCVPWVCDPD